MSSRAIFPIFIGAVVAEAIGVGLFLMMAHLFVTSARSLWVLLATFALFGGTAGGLGSLIRRKH